MHTFAFLIIVDSPLTLATAVFYLKEEPYLQNYFRGYKKEAAHDDIVPVQPDFKVLPMTDSSVTPLDITTFSYTSVT